MLFEPFPLEVVTVLRFVVWASCIGGGIISVHWYLTETVYRKAALGLAVHWFGWGAHQFYWWLSSTSKLKWLETKAVEDMIRHQEIYAERWIASYLEIILIVTFPLIVSMWLEHRLGRYWWAGGIALCVALTLTGVAATRV